MALTITVPKPKSCSDCGGDGIFHGVTYFSILIDEALARIFPPATKRSGMAQCMSWIEGLFGAWFFEGFVMLGLAHNQTTPDDNTLLLAKVLWEEAEKRGIVMWEWRLFGLARNIFIAQYPNGKKIVFEGIPETASEHERVWWMDDKGKLKKEFMKLGLPVAKGASVTSEAKARSLYATLTPPVIVKPAAGSGSRHTVLHITDEAELVRAFHLAKQVSPHVVIEKELVGPVYRATVVDGKFVAALRRDPPSVVGDGIHSIVELVVEENTKPGRQGPYFSHIKLFSGDGIVVETAAKELHWQGYTIESVPPASKRVYFHQKVNWGVGGTTADVTDEVHPDNTALFERAAQVLRAPITGIDFIIKDMALSWKDQDRCGILECNSMPFFDNHHLPFEGKPRNVAAAIWDMVTPAGAMHTK
jgi:D-alanine-D-alanine ligase-like ATP-grasp enzyme